MARPDRVTIVEVGPRDGLQNEPAQVTTADKLEFVRRLSAAAFPVIEVTAFVSPKWVPQMADAGEVFSSIPARPGTRYTALVPNLAGLDRAFSAGAREVAIFAAAILVAMPPDPTADAEPPPIASISGVISRTTASRRASGSAPGGRV